MSTMTTDVMPEMPNLSFDERKHEYRLDGDIIPSVSEIMRPLSDSAYSAVSEAVLDRAAQRGTEIHSAIECYAKFGITDIDPDYQGYFDGFVSWWDMNNPELVGSEIRVYHEMMRYGGTIDMLAYINGKLTLIDFKSTSKLLEKNVRVQLEAYSQALASHGLNIEDKRVLHLTNTGKFEDRELKTKDTEALRVWNSLKTVYDYTR